MRLTYQTANEKLTGRNRDSRKLANNTYLQRRDNGDIAIRLHQTDVVTLRPDGAIVLNSGGWRTVTTKDRIGIVANVFTEKGVWYLRHNGQTFPFADGITIHPDGTVSGAGTFNPKGDAALKRKVKAYAKLCTDSLPLPAPDGGDCWYCAMSTEDGKSLGDAFKDTEHLDYHMEEGYVVPSLVHRALTEAGAGSAYFAAAFGKSVPHEQHIAMADWAQKTIAHMVYRYVMKRKGFQV